MILWRNHKITIGFKNYENFWWTLTIFIKTLVQFSQNNFFSFSNIFIFFGRSKVTVSSLLQHNHCKIFKRVSLIFSCVLSSILAWLGIQRGSCQISLGIQHLQDVPEMSNKISCLLMRDRDIRRSKMGVGHGSVSVCVRVVCMASTTTMLYCARS